MSTDAVRAALAELVAATNPDGETSVADWRKAWAAARAALSEPVPSVGVPEWIPVHTRLPAWADDNSVRVIVYTAAIFARFLSSSLPDKQLCTFYGVDTFPALVEAMEHHIKKLQAKLPQNDMPAATKTRFA